MTCSGRNNCETCLSFLTFLSGELVQRDLIISYHVGTKRKDWWEFKGRNSGLPSGNCWRIYFCRLSWLLALWGPGTMPLYPWSEFPKFGGLCPGKKGVQPSSFCPEFRPGPSGAWFFVRKPRQAFSKINFYISALSLIKPIMWACMTIF